MLLYEKTKPVATNRFFFGGGGEEVLAVGAVERVGRWTDVWKRERERGSMKCSSSSSSSSSRKTYLTL